jgi:hypothetical protein
VAPFPFQTVRQEVGDHETRVARRRSPCDHASIVPLSTPRSRAGVWVAICARHTTPRRSARTSCRRSVVSARPQRRGCVRNSPDTAPAARDAADWEHGLWRRLGSPVPQAAPPEMLARRRGPLWEGGEWQGTPLARGCTYTHSNGMYAPRMHELPPHDGETTAARIAGGPCRTVLP